MESPVEVFCCYANEDQDFLAELEIHLSPLRRRGVIVTWHSLNIIPGTNAEEERTKHLNNAQIILLLISPHFLASDYSYDREMMRAIERHQQGEAVVIPVILRPALWEEAPFARLQALPIDKKPVVTWYHRDEAWVDIARGIEKAVGESVGKLTLPSQSKDSRESWQDSSGEASPAKPLLEGPSSSDVVARCPSCLDQFYVGDCDIISKIEGKILRKGPAPNEWRTPRRKNVETLTSPKYLRHLACRSCPHCGYLLPFNIECAKNISIAVVGDTISGKSHYIASVIHTLRERWLPEYKKSVSLTCLTPEVEVEYYENVMRPVFVNKEAVHPTQPATGNTSSRPLIYELKFKSSSGEAPKRVNLLFYDGSGEDYAWQERMIRYARHVMYASAIIFLVDPLAFPEVAKQIKAANQLPFDLITGGIDSRSPTHAIKSTLQLFERYHGSQAENLLRSLPVAMALSKADLFRHVASVAPEHGFLSHSRSGKSLNLQEINAIDKEVRALVKKYKGHSLLRLSQRFSTVSFFATSATGCAPDKQGLYRVIEPYRCLDPILWVLDHLGVFHADTR